VSVLNLVCQYQSHPAKLQRYLVWLARWTIVIHSHLDVGLSCYVTSCDISFTDSEMFVTCRIFTFKVLIFFPMSLFSSPTAQRSDSQLYRVCKGGGPVWFLPEGRMETRRLHGSRGCKYITLPVTMFAVWLIRPMSPIISCLYRRFYLVLFHCHLLLFTKTFLQEFPSIAAC